MFEPFGDLNRNDLEEIIEEERKKQYDAGLVELLP